MLTERRLKQFREKLEADRLRLLEDVNGQHIFSENGFGYSTHMADDASAAFEQAKELTLRNNAEWLLVEVEKALQKLDDGTFGYCEECGTEIDTARLKAIPYASLCLKCQELKEFKRDNREYKNLK